MTEEWDPESAQGSTRENRLIHQYFEENGGLIFTEFNVADGVPNSRQRRLDAIRFPIGDDRIQEYNSSKREEVASLLADQKCELIEVHGWGFYVLGQLIGKQELLEQHWDTEETEKVLIVDNEAGGEYHPDERRDEATHDVFDAHDVQVEVLK
ncbi:MAG: hypothetical protein ABEJ72_01825 [Candidatus Aenigmatarchaeota archaeon]